MAKNVKMPNFKGAAAAVETEGVPMASVNRA